MRVALLQMNSQNDTGHNLREAELLLTTAARQQASYALLPENFAFFGSEQEKLAKGKQIGDETMQFLAKMSAKYSLTISGGGFPLPATEKKFYNSAVTFGPDGEQLHRYDKLHLFDAVPGDNVSYLESRATQSGLPELTTFQLAPFTFGMTVCYDLRFPALYRQYARMGANVLCIPAAFTKLTGMAHWHTLLKARAIENTAYVLAAGQTGNHFGGRETYGHTIAIDPWGEVIGEVGDRPGVLIAELDASRLAEVRGRMPSLQHDKI
jgi:deaminated glutathione amidase